MLNKDRGGNAGAAVVVEPTTPDAQDATSGLVNRHPPVGLHRRGERQPVHSQGAVRGVRHLRGDAGDA